MVNFAIHKYTYNYVLFYPIKNKFTCRYTYHYTSAKLYPTVSCVTPLHAGKNRQILWNTYSTYAISGHTIFTLMIMFTPLDSFHIMCSHMAVSLRVIFTQN